MSKLPFFQFYPLDWLRDTAKLSPEAQGQWIKILCYAWNEPERGVYQRDETAACYELGIDYMGLSDLLAELAYVADVRHDKEIVRIESRRMIREEKARRLNALYQHEHRQKSTSKEVVSTMSGQSKPDMLDVRSKTLEEETPSRSPEVHELITLFAELQEKRLGRPPANFPGGMLGKFFKSTLKKYSADDIIERIHWYFNSTDPYIVKDAYSAQTFVRKFDTLKVAFNA